MSPRSAAPPPCTATSHCSARSQCRDGGVEGWGGASLGYYSLLQALPVFAIGRCRVHPPLHTHLQTLLYMIVFVFAQKQTYSTWSINRIHLFPVQYICANCVIQCSKTDRRFQWIFKRLQKDWTSSPNLYLYITTELHLILILCFTSVQCTCVKCKDNRDEHKGYLAFGWLVKDCPSPPNGS